MLTTICPQLIQNICSTMSTNKPFASIDSSKSEASEAAKKQVSYQFESENLMPIDWSLKTRLRFLSTRPFTCYNGIKSQHESEAILNYSKFNLFYENLNQHIYVCLAN